MAVYGEDFWTASVFIFDVCQE